MRKFFKKLLGITKVEESLNNLKDNCDDFIFGKSYLILRLLTANIDYVICRIAKNTKCSDQGELSPIYQKVFYSPILEPISNEVLSVWTKERWKQEGYVLWGEKYPYAVFINKKDMFKAKNAFLNQEEFFS